jgi:hypothetical protein
MFLFINLYLSHQNWFSYFTYITSLLPFTCNDPYTHPSFFLLLSISLYTLTGYGYSVNILIIIIILVRIKLASIEFVFKDKNVI